jgi:hypothetical protein
MWRGHPVSQGQRRSTPGGRGIQVVHEAGRLRRSVPRGDVGERRTRSVFGEDPGKHVGEGADRRVREAADRHYRRFVPHLELFETLRSSMMGDVDMAVPCGHGAVTATLRTWRGIRGSQFDQARGEVSGFGVAERRKRPP